MAVRKVMIVRHAEKPPKHGAGPAGVKLDGSHDDHDLTPRGWQRAGALTTLFAPVDASSSRAPLERPEIIVAAGIDATSRSRRSQSTITPTADALGLAVVASDCPGREATVAAKLGERSEQVCLICWEHKHIKDLVHEITSGAIEAPRWDGSRFDMVFVLTKGSQGWSFEQVAQSLLAGDITTTVSEPDPDAKFDYED